MELTAVLRLLKVRLSAILVCLLLGVASAALATRSSPVTYRATSSLIVDFPAARTTQEALQGVQLSTQLLASYAEIGMSRSAAQQIKDRLKLPDDVEDVRRRLQVTPQPETLLLDVSADDHDPVRAQTVADSAALVLVDLVAGPDAGREGRVQARVIDRAALPATPVSPRPVLNIGLGAVLGLAAGLLLALLLEALDRSVRTLEQAAEVTDSPLLGSVPDLRPEKLLPGTVADDRLGPAAEAYRSLRTALLYLDPDLPVHTLLVTSASPRTARRRRPSTWLWHSPRTDVAWSWSTPTSAGRALRSSSTFPVGSASPASSPGSSPWKKRSCPGEMACYASWAPDRCLPIRARCSGLRP